MNLKKLLALALALVMVFALAACGGGRRPCRPGDTGTGRGARRAATIKVAALESAYEETYPGMWQEVCDAFTAETGIAVELDRRAQPRGRHRRLHAGRRLPRRHPPGHRP